ncbi:MAG: hypothetical protein IJE68_01885 [Clostridia bacterium]|nr:hypothetical protein [Clostridia bacterium]
MKRFFTLLMALCLCVISPLTAFAAEVETLPAAETLYVQNEITPASARALTYNQVWIDAGKYSNGSFTVENPHTFIFTTTNGTLKIESNNPNAQVHIVVHDGINVILNRTLGPGDGEVYFSSQSNSAQYAVSYFVYSTNNTNGIRVNCWLY